MESKLPDGILCQHGNNESNVDMISIRNKAESILNNLAKHLVALKASEGRLNRAARRSYLQVRLCKAIATYRQGLYFLTVYMILYCLYYRISEINLWKLMTKMLFE